MLISSASQKDSGILVVGAGGHARACLDILETAGFKFIGLVGEMHEVGRSVLGYPVLGQDSDLQSLRSYWPTALVAVGQIKSPAVRIRLFEQLVDRDFCLPSVISPRAYVSPHATIGAGSIIMHGATVNAGATVGRNCIVNTNALVEHDCEIGDHCHIATRATLNGGVRIGDGVFVGSASVIRDRIVLGRGCVIGMGVSVHRNQQDDAVVKADC